MPTPISHAAVGFALAAWTQQGMPTRRVCVVAAACAALPDIDWPLHVSNWPLHLSTASLFGHRAITHSLTFALLAAVAVTSVFFRGGQWAQLRVRIAFILGLALASHSCLDALSTYSVGVEFFAPFSQQRFRFGWTPLGDPNWSLVGQFVQEAFFVLLPGVLIAWFGFKLRRRDLPPRAVAA